jgi:hypothetical protein
MSSIQEEAVFLAKQINYTNIWHDNFILVHGVFIVSFEDKSYLFDLVRELRSLNFYEPLNVKDCRGYYHTVTYTQDDIEMTTHSGPYPDVDFRSIKEEEDNLRKTYHNIQEVNESVNNLVHISSDMIPVIRENYNQKSYDSDYALFAERCNADRLVATEKDVEDLSYLIPEHLQDSLVIAGGFVVNNILGLKLDKHIDVDMFIVSENPTDVLEKYIKWIKITHICNFAKRNDKVITLALKRESKTIPLQIMLRAYKSPEQIIVGFDIDACSVCYYKGEYYATKRGFFALNNRINHVDVDRISPSYEHRLLKYAINKGFYVRQPLFNRAICDKQLTDAYHRKIMGSGLPKLLLLEIQYDKYRKITAKISDYDDMEDLSKLKYLFNRKVHKYDSASLSNIHDSASLSNIHDSASLSDIHDGAGNETSCVYFRSCYLTNNLDLILHNPDLKDECRLPINPEFITNNPEGQGFYDMATSSWTPIIKSWKEWNKFDLSRIPNRISRPARKTRKQNKEQLIIIA